MAMGGPPVDGFIEQDARRIITGWSADSEQLSGWSRAEAIGFLSKPIDQRSLVEIVEQ
jgi:hypothetical protein